MTTYHSPRTTHHAPSRWLHYWAILTVGVALPLVLLGAEVTTRKVGMADEVGFRAPWHLLTLHLEDSLKEKGLGFVIEHSHRIAGFVVGTCAIVLAVGLWCSASQRGLRWLGVAALVGVALQGVLGIFRVNLHEWMGPYLALVHGCFGQLVFALLVSVAVLTAPGWQRTADAASSLEPTGRLRHGALAVTGLVVLQLVLGAFLRHRSSPLSQRLHLLVAFAVLAAVIWLLKSALEDRSGHKLLTRAVVALSVLVGLQVLLGVETWMIRFAGLGILAPERVLWHRDLIRTAHVLVGALILAGSVVVTLQTYRSAWRAGGVSPLRTPEIAGLTPPAHRQLEGVA